MNKLTRSTCLAVALLPVSLVGGCALAPGGHIDYEAQEMNLDNQVDIVSITPQLISNYRAENGTTKAQSMSPEMIREIEEYQYYVGPGDVLNIIVYDHPELTIPAGSERSAEESGTLVHADGTIYYPYIGNIQVEGKTVNQIRSILTQRLATYIAEPQVEVNVAAFRSKKYYISGEVEAPGTQPITNVAMTVLDAISQAGGATENANWHNVTLTRNGQERTLSLYDILKKGDLTQNTLMQAGDVLHVSSAENQNISVLGQVRNPGNVQVGREYLSLTDALSRAGGVVESRAEPSGIFVIRAKPQGSDKMATVFQLDISNAVALNMGSYFPLEPQDVVYVTSAPLARWNNVISLLLPSISLPSTVADTTSDVGDL
ncbi:polysaccharide export protein [Halomonas stenophila]|uniref:Polysaccharide export outer membrane protein n=1 Tax=Halomonas stenophila TaxID=795312 RepID=A0A7W5HJZ4_9GAMM|nr:polysaccharide export protein [Halomonas stenophila]MBB3229539.1 polysaccharide export outer membrane protein [Halomonas stenophila]